MTNRCGIHTVSDSLYCLSYTHLPDCGQDDHDREVEVQLATDLCTVEETKLRNYFSTSDTSSRDTFHDEDIIQTANDRSEGTNAIVDRLHVDNFGLYAIKKDVLKPQNRPTLHSTKNSQKRCNKYSTGSLLSTIYESISFEDFMDTMRHNSEIGSLLDFESEEDIRDDISGLPNCYGLLGSYIY
jgi:hypothetical protein